MMGWVHDELAETEIGDRRLNKRTISLVESLDNLTEASFSVCFQTRAELTAAYRLFDNNLVTPEKILSGHIKSTIKRIRDQKVVLLPNDTSSIDYTSKNTVEGLGILETSYTKGLLIHPTIAITPERVSLGLIDVQIWARNGDLHRKALPSEVRMNQPIEEKESFRWIKSYRKACEIARECPQTHFVSVGDRESDILELIVEGVQAKDTQKNIDLLLRVNHDRLLVVDKQNSTQQKKETGFDEMPLGSLEDERKLKKKLTKAQKLGEIEFVLSPRAGKNERTIKQTIRATTVKLHGKKVGDQKYPSVSVNAVCCIEENPPKGEDPVIWMFLTTLPIDTLEQVLDIIKFYLGRWDIETFFMILKSGCKIEERELKTSSRLKNMMALFFILAWRLMYIMNMGRKYPQIQCTELFEDSEWKSIYKITKNSAIPSVPPSLGDIILMIAKLGGYIMGKKRPPPGPKVLWKGLKRMSDFALAWEKF